MILKRVLTALVSVAIVAALFYTGRALFKEPEFVLRKGGHVYIEDDAGKRWEVSQAESMGFSPGEFVSGMGRDAFSPRDGDRLKGDAPDVSGIARVIGVTAGGKAMAYFVTMLRRHEVINDNIGGRPVAAAYREQADLAVVYDRVLKGDTLSLRASGWTYKEVSILVDEETGSLWCPDRQGLRAIQGQHLGQRLSIVESADTTWGQWKARHPDSHILK